MAVHHPADVPPGLDRRVDPKGGQPELARAISDLGRQLARLWNEVKKVSTSSPGPHAETHLVAGEDPLPRAIEPPPAVLVGGTSSAGTGPSYMREDAQLVVGAAAPANPTGPAAIEGTAGTVMRSDATIKQGIVTTKGDLLGYSTEPALVPVGATALSLVADDAQALGVRWGPIILSPAQITANQNDFEPGPISNVWRLTSDAARNITGIDQASDGTELRIINVGGFSITLKHQDVASSVNNRFLNKGAADIVLAPDETAYLFYDATTARWRATKL